VRAYVLRKIGLLAGTLFGASLVVFLGLRVIPGDPAQMMAGEMGTAGDVQRLRQELGLNQPVYVQYARFLAESARGNFGRSLRAEYPVTHVIGDVFPATVELGVTSLALACAIGWSAGTLAAIKHNTGVDSALTVLVLFGVSMPSFWVGILLILTFALQLGVFPAGGALSLSVPLHRVTGMYVVDSLIQGNWPALKDALMHLALPALTLALYPAGIIARMTRSAMLEVLRQDYITTARSKGLSERTVVLRHALRNSLIPVVTVVGLQLGYLISGAVVVEAVFARPGMGRLAVTSILFRDYPVVQGIVAYAVVAFVLVNLLVDVTYAYLDPRIAYT